MNWADKPEIYKSIPSCKSVQLPSQHQESTILFAEVLQRRKSVRAFSTQPLSKADLAFLLWASTGIQRVEHGYEFRTAPSAGALYPIETYISANNVEGLENGIYHYNIRNHLLEEIKTGNFGDALAHAALDQKMCAVAPAVFIWTAFFGRSKWKYRREPTDTSIWMRGILRRTWRWQQQALPVDPVKSGLSLPMKLTQ